MNSTLILSVQDARVSYGPKPFFEDLTFHIQEHDRICLVGRNGAGKTTLMNVITGRKEIDEGERWQLQGTTIGYLQQELKPKAGESVFDFVFAQISGEDKHMLEYKVEQVLQPLHIDPRAAMDRLSGGQVRRAALARALVEDPDILLLDEPTNHLDLEVIEWLEGYLKSRRGSFLCISHDRTFLSNISDKIFWLDRGKLKTCPRGFSYFDEWSQMLLEQEERELKNRKKTVEIEVEWASRGVKARRKRNMRRLEQMKIMCDRLKADQSAFRRATSKVDLEPLPPAQSAKIVAEFFKVGKSFAEEGRGTTILDGFSLRIMRGDRIGILGKNGSGKTSFLRLLIGELEPDRGKVKRAKNLEFSYFDQKRRDLEDGDTLKKTLCPHGGDYLEVMGKTRHVCGYLKDFMFDPLQAQDRVRTLSGGQKNRLMLAKVLADPGAFLILDEPTNDLDMDTLDMLEEVLSKYEGTLIVVSHDRDFLDQSVTKILAFEGEGEVKAYIGGYSDYLAQKREDEGGGAKKEAPVKEPVSAPEQPADKPQPKAGKLSYKLQYELERLPEKIARLEEEKAALEEKMRDADFYSRDTGGFYEATKRFERTLQKLEQAEERWLELEEMKAGE